MIDFAKQNAFPIAIFLGSSYIALGRLKNLQDGQGCPKCETTQAFVAGVMAAWAAWEIWKAWNS